VRLWLKDSERLPDPPPMKTDDRAAIGAGTVLWAIAGVFAFVFAAPLNDDGFGWVVPMTVVGVALGVVGLGYSQVRRARAARSARR
jgi:VIT1/CCC1 family predicted Fe2+/Mn2+ transporter